MHVSELLVWRHLFVAATYKLCSAAKQAIAGECAWCLGGFKFTLEGNLKRLGVPGGL